MSSSGVSLPSRKELGQARAAISVVVPGEEYSDVQLDIICDTVMPPNASRAELAQFLAACQATQLSPFNKQIYAIRRKGKLTVQTGIDGYVTMAQRTGDYAGCDEPWFDVDPVELEKLREETGQFHHPRACKVTVRRKSGGYAVGLALWSEYAAYYGNDLGDTWKAMPHTMLEKCAFAKALRKLFGADVFAGVYAEEEMQQAEARHYSTPASPPMEPTHDPVRKEHEQPAPQPQRTEEPPPEVRVIDVEPDPEPSQGVETSEEPPIDRMQEWCYAIDDCNSKDDLAAIVQQLKTQIPAAAGAGRPYSPEDKALLKGRIKSRASAI